MGVIRRSRTLNADGTLRRTSEEEPHVCRSSRAGEGGRPLDGGAMELVRRSETLRVFGGTGTR